MFGNKILELLGQQDPRMAALAALQGGASTQQAGDGTQGGAAGAPGTSAPPQPQQPLAHQSPQELTQLYMELMKRNRQEQSIDRGIGLIGASLAQPENRPGIMAMFGGGGGGSGEPQEFIKGLMEFQANNAQLQQKAAQRAAIPSIAAQYGLDVTTAQYLFDTGKLDSVIAELEKPDRQIVSGADGKSYIVDKSTGAISEGLGPDKPREIELVDDGRGGKIAVYSDDKTPVGRNDIPGMGPNSELQTATGINEDRVARGLEPRPVEELVREGGQSRAGASNLSRDGINVGNPPTDMAWERDAEGYVVLNEQGLPNPIPMANTKLAAEREGADQMAQDRQQIRHQTSSIVLDSIGQVEKIIDDLQDDWVPATGWGAFAGYLPNTPQYDAAQYIETIKANIGFDKLQSMREASPTGGALGQVSDFENRLLQATMGSLDLKQRGETVKRNLTRVRSLYSKVDEILNAPDMETANRLARELDTMLPEAESVTESSNIDELLKLYGGQ